MAKARKSAGKESKATKSSKKIDGKVLDELAKSLKKEFEESREKDESGKSELEEDIENIGSFDDFEFSPSAIDESSSSPVLERIAGKQAGPIFVGGIPQGQQSDFDGEKGGDFKYMPGQNSAGEPKYLDSDSHMSASTENIDFEKVGRGSSVFEPWKNISQEAMFMQSSEARGEQRNQERIFAAERFDSEKEREREKRKYSPDLPKSR